MRYTREDGCRAWLAYALLDQQLLADLLDTYDSAEGIYETFLADKGAFLQELISPQRLATLRKQATPEAMHATMLAMHRHNLGILSQEDYEYPDALRAIPDAPQYLFYIGDPAIL